MLEVVFKTAIDKYKNKFSSWTNLVPRVGEFIIVDKIFKDSLPFDKLQVVTITYAHNSHVIVELHLSDLQAKENQAYNLNVFN